MTRATRGTWASLMDSWIRNDACEYSVVVHRTVESRHMSLGQLERKVMDILWDAGRGSLSGREVADQLPERAYTTVMTILERLRRKKLVVRSTKGRVHTFRAAASREAYMASLMLQPLSSTQNRNAVLAHFAQRVSPEEAEVLRDALDAARRSQ
jgi:predicted transcriptional regulator